MGTADLMQKQQTDAAPKQQLDERGKRRCRDLADHLIEPLRAVAREHGYALGVHGSLQRDIDLIAAPWSVPCSEPKVLAEALRQEAARLNHDIAVNSDAHHAANPDYFHDGCPGAKHHGRLCWTFHLGGGPYIDLSVMPPDPGAQDRIHEALLQRFKAEKAV